MESLPAEESSTSLYALLDLMNATKCPCPTESLLVEPLKEILILAQAPERTRGSANWLTCKMEPVKLESLKPTDVTVSRWDFLLRGTAD
jgi:hypothetical protein